MNKLIKKEKKLIIAFALGAIVAVFCVHAYMLIQLEREVNQNTANISAIVNFINGQK